MAASTPSITAADGAQLRGVSGVRVRPVAPGAALVIALLAAVGYAVFDHGATSYPAEARVQVVLAAVALAACTIGLWSDRAAIVAPATAWAGLLALSLFAVWSGVSLAWSVAPEGTWVELNRAIAYTLVAGLGLVAARWHARAVEWVALGYLALAVLVALYALAGKIIPEVHIGGIVDFDTTADFARLRAPLQYWNALSLFCLLAVPIAVREAVDVVRRRRTRLAALAALCVLLLTVALTYSRGGVIATVVALAATLVLAGDRLRSLLLVAIALLGAVPPLLIGFSNFALTHNGVPLADRRHSGAGLGIVLVMSLAFVVAAGWLILRREPRVAASAARSRLIGLILAALLGAAVLAGVGAMAVSDRGLGGTISHQWDSFRTVKGHTQSDPGRLLSTNSSNRWVWWKEAAGAWSDRPLQGWGAGSFPVLHREYRTDQLDVLQPHSVPLQWLAETGLIGALLAGGGLILLLVAGLGAVRRAAPGSSRGLAAALWAGALAWTVHGLYDWDWDIPGVTIPALLFLGVLAGARSPRDAARSGGPPPRSRGRGVRALALAVAAVALCTAAVSAVLPSWAQTKSDASIGVLSGSASEAHLRDAAVDAELASRLDPLSIESLIDASAIAGRRGDDLASRAYLVDATRRQPDNALAWAELARVEFDLGDVRGVRAGARRALALDPRSRGTRTVARVAADLDVPPEASATATGTPLPRGR